jgi:catechol 2,3-dioxygenase-like lactoylglutathione lyase family enzyme
MADSSSDPRPPVWVGHVVLPVAEVAASAEYWTRLGLRFITQGEGFAVLELRGGTHLVLLPAGAPVQPGTPAPFDLMVEDLPATRQRFAELGLGPSEVSSGEIHDSFTLSDPSGYAVTVNSSHVGDLPV